MNCTNCGAKLSENSAICEFCGTKNDLDLLEINPVGSSDTFVREEHAAGEGNIDEITMEESLQRLWWELRIGEKRYWKNKIKDNIISVYIVSIIILGIIIAIFFYQYDKTKYYNKGMDKLKKGIYIYYERGTDRGAIHFFNQSLSMVTNNKRIHYLIGVAGYYDYLNLTIEGERTVSDRKRMYDDLTYMEENLKKAIKSSYNYPEAHYYLGLYYIRIHAYDQALNEFEQSIYTAGNIWKFNKRKKDKWVKASELMKKVTSSLISGKDTSYAGIMPPMTAEFNYNDFKLVKYPNGTGTIIKKEKVLVENMICPPLPDEIENLK
jgi:tetratricopeptide (TPR) repeat protein